MSHVDYKIWQCRRVEFKRGPCRPVDFKKGPCRMSLRPKKGRVAVSILGVYIHFDAFLSMCREVLPHSYRQVRQVFVPDHNLR